MGDKESIKGLYAYIVAYMICLRGVYFFLVVPINEGLLKNDGYTVVKHMI